jgi:predicted ATPase
VRTLVGREQQLAVIDAALDDAAAGRGRLVMIAGEPGIGKTSLADAATTRATTRGFRVLCGASDAEIAEALAMASLTRDMSTLLNGLQIDEAQYRRDVDRLVKGAQAAAKASAKAKPTAQR